MSASEEPNQDIKECNIVGVYCVVESCKNNAGNYTHGFFRFPKDNKRAKEWAIKCKREDLLDKNLYNFRICAQHFSQEMFKDQKRKGLTSNAYPTIFSDDIVTEPSQKNVQIYEPPVKKTKLTMDYSVPGTSKEKDLELIPKQVISDDILLETSMVDFNPDENLQVDPDVLEEEVIILPESDLETPRSDSPESRPSTGIQTPKTLSSKSPRKAKYKKTIKALRNQNRHLQEKIVALTTDSHQIRVDDSREMFNSLCDKYLSPTQANFVKMQAIQASRSAMGRRYSDELKQLCLSLYFKGPKAYRHLSKIFVLPTVRTLRRMTAKNYFGPGIHNQLFDTLKSKIDQFSYLDRHCVLTMDEMSLKSHLYYNITTDEVVGFESYGDRKVLKPALNSTVFMLRGISSNWKQPVGYYFVHSVCSAVDLKVAIEAIYRYARNIDLHIVAVISDQGSNFVQLTNILGVTCERPYFFIDDQKIVYLFDPPHLLKSIRNNIMKYSFQVNTKKVSWDYIKSFYYMDKAKNNKYCWKLTESHINPNNLEKMKVFYAAQVLSASVAAGMEVYLSRGELPSDAVGTIEFIEMFDKLFDIFNSSSNYSPKRYAHSFKNEEIQLQVLDEVYTYLSNVQVIDNQGKDHRNSIKCISGWKISIKGLLQLWDTLSDHGFNYLLTRRLNQDCLENYFGSIRQQGGNSISPTPIQFLRAFKKHFCMDFFHSGTENCAEDFTTMLATLQNVETTGFGEDTQPEIIHETTAQIGTDYYKFNIHEQNSLRYVCGYLIRKCLSVHTCNICKDFSESHSSLDETSVFCHFKAYDISEKTFGNLKMPHDNFIAYITSLEKIFYDNFEVLVLHKGIVTQLTNVFTEKVFEHPCQNFPYLYLKKLYSRMKLYHTLKSINMNFKDTTDKKKRKSIIWKH